MTVSIAVIGCGWWSTAAHLPAVVDDPRADLVAAVDADPTKVARAVHRFQPLHAYGDHLQMLDEVSPDAVVVATPAAQHFAPALAALERGIAVLVEKPMVLAPRDGDRLLDAAERSGTTLAVGYTYHHTPLVIRLRGEIAAGRIGDIEHVTCTFASAMRETLAGQPAAGGEHDTGFDMSEIPVAGTYADMAQGGGQAFAQLTHSAALALHLAGARPARVSAMTATHGLAVDIADVLAVETTDGSLVALDSVGTVSPGQPEILQCRLFGTRGHIQLDAVAGRATIHGERGQIEELPPAAADEIYPTAAPVQNLVGCVLGEEPNRADGALGLDVVRLLDAAHRSAATGRRIDLADLSA